MPWGSLELVFDAEKTLLLILLAGFFLMFVWELLSVDIIAIVVVLTLVYTSTLDVNGALLGFGNPAVIGIGALFIVSEGLLRTGALGIVANHLESWSGGRERRLILLILVIVAVSSAFMNNTPVVAMFIPVVLGLSHRMHINPSHILIPLSYAAILGGTCTLIGTSTNILVSNLVKEHGQPPLALFDFFKLGSILVGIGLVYLIFIGPRLLPDRQTITSMTSGDRRLREYVTELEVRAGGDFDGQLFPETKLATIPGIRVIQVIRGEEITWPPFDEARLHAGDAVIIAGKIEDLMTLHEEEGLTNLQQIISEEDVGVRGKETELSEVLVLPNSQYVGKTLEEATIRSQFDVNVIAIQRHGMHLRRKISVHPLRVGDVLLVQGTTHDLGRLGSAEGLVLMSGVQDVVVRKHKAPIAALIMLGVLVMLAAGPFEMPVVALTGAVAMVLSGCLPAGKVYDSIHWRVLVLIGGTLALGLALDRTGTAAMIAGWLQAVVHDPRWLVVVVLILSSLLTECISNTAVAAVMIPIALKIPGQLGDPADFSHMPFVMAVAFGASCSFVTPIGYQTNTLVYGAGGYRFGDFARIGLPLVILVWITAGILIPVFWPIQP